jgi:DNA-binding CsgD family transcriptional regulator/tetratricopeptide (TPR) repeat protein
MVGGARSWPLTGRLDELERLAELADDPACAGVVIVGAAGVGKTRLVEDALDRAERAGERVARAVGHEAARDIPLGALTHLLPADAVARVGIGGDERTALFHAARAELAPDADGRRRILFVDDIDLLDDTSVALLVPLVVGRDVFLVGTVRSGRTPSARLARLQRDGHIARIDLEPLGADDLSALLHRALDAPCSAAALAELERLSGGNLQILTELVRGARERGSLELREGVWDLAGPITTTTVLEELVAEHLADVGEDGRHVLEVLAVCERLGLADLDGLAAPGVLESLEADGLVDVVTSDRRTAARLAHPLYGEVLAASLPPLRRRAVERALADLLDGHGCRRRGDESRVVLWRLAGGEDVDAARRMRAARLALVAHDAELAERVAVPEPPASADDELRAERLQILAEAAALTGRHDEVERQLAATHRLDLDDAIRARIATRLAEHRFFAASDLDGAVAAVQDALVQVSHPSAEAALDAERALLLANAGRPAAALEIIDGLPAELEPRTAVDVAAARSSSLVAVGRLGDGAAAAREAAELQSRLPGWLARKGSARHVVNEAHAFGYGDRHTEALAILEPAIERAREAGAMGALVWFEMAASEVYRDMGDGLRSLRFAESVVAAAPGAGQHAVLVWAYVGIAQGHLLLGECDPATAAIDAATDVGVSPVATSHTTLERARAWLDACRGDLAGARARLAPIADMSRRDGIATFESAVRHDIARFGDPASVVGRLTELGEQIDADVYTAFAAHARALAEGDADALGDVVDAFVAAECFGQAAEASAERAELLARAGDRRAAALAEQRTATIVSRIGRIATPPLARATGVEPLTAREREVALLAAGGAASKEIADRLHLSARTVDTHLARVYRKLGISGRTELQPALRGDARPPTT